MSLKSLITDLHKLSDGKKAEFYPRYFKSGPGGYAEGDIFIGVTVPQSRLISKKYKTLPLDDVEKLLRSKIHEERQVALMILSLKAQKADEKELAKLHKFYLKNLKFVNNWDLVDGSAEILVGKYLESKNKNLLATLAKSDNLWERRIAIISTFHFIKNNKYDETLKISKILLKDKHDLIHKAIGWMLREVGKRSEKTLEQFLIENYSKLPRTTLRYAIERFSEVKRRNYLQGTIRLK